MRPATLKNKENVMANNQMIKDFIKAQTTPIEIRKPRLEAEKSGGVETKNDIKPEAAETQQLSIIEKKRIKKIQLTYYITEEEQEKLIRIQHKNYIKNMSTLISEGIKDLIKKYGE